MNSSCAVIRLENNIMHFLINAWLSYWIFNNPKTNLKLKRSGSYLHEGKDKQLRLFANEKYKDVSNEESVSYFLSPFVVGVRLSINCLLGAILGSLSLLHLCNIEMLGTGFTCARSKDWQSYVICYISIDWPAGM